MQCISSTRITKVWMSCGGLQTLMHSVMQMILLGAHMCKFNLKYLFIVSACRHLVQTVHHSMTERYIDYEFCLDSFSHLVPTPVSDLLAQG